jgi:hypothetical protein
MSQSPQEEIPLGQSSFTCHKRNTSQFGNDLQSVKEGCLTRMKYIIGNGGKRCFGLMSGWESVLLTLFSLYL